MTSSSEDSALLALTQKMAAPPQQFAAAALASAPRILVSKVLTYSDVSTDVARTGRIVLPRIQVQACLPELLECCGAAAALPALRGSGNAVKLSTDLSVVDEAGRSWVLLLKTWQNVVSGEHRPTFVLENTADFVRANRLTQGNTLAFCPVGNRMQLRTSLRPDQLPPRAAAVKRPAGASGGGAAAPAAKRRTPAPRLPPAADWTHNAWPAAAVQPPPGLAASGSSSRRRRTAPPPPPTPDHVATPATAPFWRPQASHAEEAAQVLLDLHGGPADSSVSEQVQVAAAAASRGPSPASAPAEGVASAEPPRPASLQQQLAQHRSMEAAAAAPAHQTLAGFLAPYTGAAQERRCTLHRPRAVRGGFDVAALRHAPGPAHPASFTTGGQHPHLQQLHLSTHRAANHDGGGPPAAVPSPAAAALAGLLSARLAAATAGNAATSAQLAPEAVAQAHHWLAAVLTRHQQAQRWHAHTASHGAAGTAQH